MGTQHGVVPLWAGHTAAEWAFTVDAASSVHVSVRCELANVAVSVATPGGASITPASIGTLGGAWSVVEPEGTDPEGGLLIFPEVSAYAYNYLLDFPSQGHGVYTVHVSVPGALTEGWPVDISVDTDSELRVGVTLGESNILDTQQLSVAAGVFLGDQPVAGATVQVRIGADDATPVLLVDDGQLPDVAAGDGLYSALVPIAPNANIYIAEQRVVVVDVTGELPGGVPYRRLVYTSFCADHSGMRLRGYHGPSDSGAWFASNFVIHDGLYQLQLEARPWVSGIDFGSLTGAKYVSWSIAGPDGVPMEVWSEPDDFGLSYSAQGKSYWLPKTYINPSNLVQVHPQGPWRIVGWSLCAESSSEECGGRIILDRYVPGEPIEILDESQWDFNPVYGLGFSAATFERTSVSMDAPYSGLRVAAPAAYGCAAIQSYTYVADIADVTGQVIESINGSFGPQQCSDFGGMFVLDFSGSLLGQNGLDGPYTINSIRFYRDGQQPIEVDPLVTPAWPASEWAGYLPPSDCNGNNVPDRIDFLDGTSEDDNDNGVPDECECPADFDQNGFVNADDFDAFIVAFEAGDPAADFDENGFVNADDFDGFIERFEAGC